MAEQEQKQSISAWERARGLMIVGAADLDLSRDVTEFEFDKIIETRQTQAVDIDARTDWLTANGYEVTRRNILNTDLVTAEERENDPEHVPAPGEE